jgi:hypothetical protein
MTVINLIPASVQRARRQRRHIHWWAATALTALTAAAVMGALEWYRTVEAERLRGQSAELHDQLDSVRTDLRTLSERAEQVRQHLERAAALRAKRAWSGLFAVIGSAMPESCWLVSLATEPATPGAAGSTVSSSRAGVARSRALGGADPAQSRRGLEAPQTRESLTAEIDAPRKLRLVGYGPDAADPHVFVTNLKSAAVFTRVSLLRSERETVLDRSYFRFELVCEW